jgi:hypothetical protein
MKKNALYLVFAFALALATGCNESKEKKEYEMEEKAGAYAGPPYTIQLQEYVNDKLPDLHSYTHAIYKDKIVMIGGRTNGLHGNSYQFYQENSNKNIWVIDTKNWGDPASWLVDSMADTKINIPNINTQQLRANNAEFFTDDSVLYIVGGLLGSNVSTRLKNPKNPGAGIEKVPGAKTDDGKAPSGPLTLPYLTAITLPTLINAVMNNQPMAAGSIRQVLDSSFALTGGELSLIDKTVYMVFGWNFGANELYSHQVRTFTYKDDGKTLSISPIKVCSTCWDGQPGNSNTGNFRRRDGSMSAMIDPSDGSQALLYYSGVFKNGITNFDSPVWIGKNDAAEQSFVMRSNVYTCQVVPVYSASRKESYGTLLGGMRNATYTGGPVKLPTALTESNAPQIPADTINFTSVPFSNQFSTVLVNAKHGFGQFLLPDSFPATIRALKLPASIKDSIGAVMLPAGSVTFNGAEAELLWTLNSGLLPNGVVDYDAFIKANPKGGMIGYLHGGIQSALVNVFGVKAAHYSVASNRIFGVKIVPLDLKK